MGGQGWFSSRQRAHGDHRRNRRASRRRLQRGRRRAVIRVVTRHLPLTIVAAGLFFLLLIPVAAQETPGPGRGAQGRGGGGGGTPGPGRGRGAAAGPSKPTPRFPDGHVNLGAPAGGSGFWGGGGSIVGKRGSSLPTNPDLAEVPFQSWAKALYEV